MVVRTSDYIIIIYDIMRNKKLEILLPDFLLPDFIARLVGGI